MDYFSFLLTLISLTFGVYVARDKLKLTYQKRALKKLVSFDDKDLVVVLPYIETFPETLVPRTSAEDFAAFLVMLNVLFDMEWRGKLIPMTADEVSPTDLERNLLLVCAGKSNPLTDKVIEKAIDRFGYDMFRFTQLDGRKEWEIRDSTSCYQSPSYREIEQYSAEGLVLREQEIHDVALITKFRNPWNTKNCVLILAGLRAIGTWGAAEFICKEWKQLYKQKSRFRLRKHGDFAAIVSVSYSNSRIIGEHVEAFKEFT